MLKIIIEFFQRVVGSRHERGPVMTEVRIVAVRMETHIASLRRNVQRIANTK
jgi:hypothetical protein